MPKVYQPPTGTEKGTTDEKDSGAKKTFGVFDQPARAMSPATIAILVVVALIIIFAVYMLMRQ